MSSPFVTLGEGMLRWLQVMDEATWHLSFDGVVTLCEERPERQPRMEALGEWIPLDYCPACKNVARFVLGLVK